MSELHYGVFLNGNKVLSVLGENGWTFPSTLEPTCYGDYDPFKKIVLNEKIKN